jgi:hypothetical protein
MLGMEEEVGIEADMEEDMEEDMDLHFRHNGRSYAVQ